MRPPGAPPALFHRRIRQLSLLANVSHCRQREQPQTRAHETLAPGPDMRLAMQELAEKTVRLAPRSCCLASSSLPFVSDGRLKLRWIPPPSRGWGCSS